PQLGEVASERPAVARLQEDLLAVDERQAAKAVELDLVAVLIPVRQLLAGESELGSKRRLERQAHERSPPARRARLGCTLGGSPLCLRKCGGQGASPSPSRSSRAASSRSESRPCWCSSIEAEGSPSLRSRAGTGCRVS